MSSSAHFREVWGGDESRKITTSRKQAITLVFRRVWVVAGKRKAQPPKTSGRARFQEVWVVVPARGRSNPRKRAVVLIFRVVVARGRPNPRKRAVVLVFEGCGWWCWPEESSTPKNERYGSFSGVGWWWWLSWRGQPAQK
jgi:hypothetical protein